MLYLYRREVFKKSCLKLKNISIALINKYIELLFAFHYVFQHEMEGIFIGRIRVGFKQL